MSTRDLSEYSPVVQEALLAAKAMIDAHMGCDDHACALCCKAAIRQDIVALFREISSDLSRLEPKVCSDGEHSYVLAKLVASNGAIMFCRRCEMCSARTSWISHSDLSDDEKAGAACCNEIRSRQQDEKGEILEYRLSVRNELDEASDRTLDYINRRWWARYSNYLLSGAWRAKRQLVFQRSGRICEGCMIAEAKEVHHLSYDHVGEEFAFELAAFCAECHTRWHGHGERLASCRSQPDTQVPF